MRIAIGNIALRGLELAVRVGINTGPVVVGDLIGKGQAEETSVVGETPNVAARLQGLARPNQVVVGPLTRELIGEAFVCEDLGTNRLKGVVAPVQAWRVVRERDIGAHFDADRVEQTSELVGRQEELGLLIRSWEASRNGHGQVVLIQGDAGIGKSRLLRALREKAAIENRVWVAMRCSPYHRNTTLHPVIERLKRVIGWDAEDSPNEAITKLESVLSGQTLALEQAVPLYAHLLSLPLLGSRYAALESSAEEQREQTLDALAGWLLDEAERSPVLRVWEDIHWADATTFRMREPPSRESWTLRRAATMNRASDFARSSTSYLSLAPQMHGDSVMRAAAIANHLHAFR